MVIPPQRRGFDSQVMLWDTREPIPGPVLVKLRQRDPVEIAQVD